MSYNFRNLDNLHVLNNHLPGNLEDLLPLRFRLREGLRYFRQDNGVLAEARARGRRYSLQAWQYEMLIRFDGQRSFEDVAKEVYRLCPGTFSAAGLVNFYHWLASEDLVVCQCESIFELVGAESSFELDEEERETALTRVVEFTSRAVEDRRVRRGMAIAAGIALTLSVIRLVQVAAPAFEPPVQRFYAEISKWQKGTEPTVSLASAERSAASPSVEKVSLASRAPQSLPSGPVEASPAAETGREADELMSRIEQLRVQLEECRIRRDEFYLQNDEDGYRREVHRMTDLAKEIGDLEKGDRGE